MNQWHAIVPFYFGANRYVVNWHGGAPVSKKLDYLSKTINSLTVAIPDIDITVAICNRESRDAARRITRKLRMIECEARHLPFECIMQIMNDEGRSWRENDIVLFNEDDQVLYMRDSVRADIELQGNTCFFSPHRWSRNFLGLFEKHGRCPFKFGRVQGMLENSRPSAESLQEISFNHHYRIQRREVDAYAACWAAHASLVRSLPLESIAAKTPHKILELASFALIQSGMTVLKLNLDKEDPAGFLADHLSGHDYFRRMYSWRSIWSHVATPFSR